jgi:hypothetical protein
MQAEEAVKSTKAQFEAISERVKKEWKRFDIARVSLRHRDKG